MTSTPTYQVGDPDPYPTLPADTRRCTTDHDAGWCCTLPRDHDGPHDAGTGQFIAAVWR